MRDSQEVTRLVEEQSTFRAGEFMAEDLGPLSPNPPQVTADEVVAYKAK